MSVSIVYLDDETDLCEMFEEMFLRTDIQAKAFSEPADFFEYMKAHSPDVIFLDYRLPNTNGDRIAAQLNSSTPKILVTGDLQVKPESPFVKIIKKPYKKQQLIDIILELTGHLTNQK